MRTITKARVDKTLVRRSSTMTHFIIAGMMAAIAIVATNARADNFTQTILVVGTSTGFTQTAL